MNSSSKGVDLFYEVYLICLIYICLKFLVFRYQPYIFQKSGHFTCSLFTSCQYISNCRAEINFVVQAPFNCTVFQVHFYPRILLTHTKNKKQYLIALDVPRTAKKCVLDLECHYSLKVWIFFFKNTRPGIGL